MSISRHQAVGAYRPWAPPAFDGAPEAAPPEAPPPAPAEPEPVPEPATLDPALLAALNLPTAEDLERMHDEARASGHAEGLAAGREEGLRSGHEEGFAKGYAEGKALAEQQAARLGALADGFDQAISAVDAEVAEDLLALAIEIARQMVQHSLLQHPQGVVETVRAALGQLPQAHAQIRIHPDDAALVREHLGEQLAHAGQRIVEDSAITPGGCRIESAGAQIDATMETRWRRVLENMGRQQAEWQPGE
ncbi:flagellar assembly protein FliH [Azoarcus olearius]|uniref:Flagellar assembly protein FliH n=1 Tax=Azoarcus sp. (strain BH72) TaxID=418699 RepID=A1K929_AZOSB|nr:flagellar assembly protein FliH [Azoarcus olearius]CAL95334.1 flagellar assembly protein FliH [Azoarcus olearius]